MGVPPTNSVCLEARDLRIVWGNDEKYWTWEIDSRYCSIARLRLVYWFDVSGEIICTLPPGAYTFSWRIRLDKPVCWDNKAVHFKLSKDGVQVDERKCFLSKRDVRIEWYKGPTIRIVENGWTEYDVGEFVVESGERTCELKFAMQNLGGDSKTGISLDGVIVQPKSAASVADGTPTTSLDSSPLPSSSSARVESASVDTSSLDGEHSRALEWTNNSIEHQRDEVAVQPTSTARVAPGVRVPLCQGHITPAVYVHLGATSMNFAWPRDTTTFGRFWKWSKDSTALHSVVAILYEVTPFDASGEIICPLPPGTYTFSWRIRLDKPLWWDVGPVNFTLFKGDVEVSERKCVLSKSYIQVEHFKAPTIRVVANGWREYDVGVFVVESGERMCHLKFRMQGSDSKTGISLDGVVVQPTSTLCVESMSGETQSQESHVATYLCDPFYPYFHCLPCESNTKATECSSRPSEIPVWRALVDSEVGAEGRLRKSFEPKRVKELLTLHSEGVSAQEQFQFLRQHGEGVRAQDDAEKQQKSAEFSFSELRRDIVCAVGQLETHDYAFLLAWADLPLAQLFQSRGGAEMLNSAMNIRKEVLECVMPLQSSHESLVRVCKTYVYTAQYEWGAASMSAQTRNEATLAYSTLMKCNEGEAEAQLCFLLCVDHEYSGSSKDLSLRWIQEANRIWKRNSPDEGNTSRNYFLRYEAKMLMNLSMKLWEDSIHFVEDPEHHSLLKDCITEISKRTVIMDDTLLEVYNGKLAESQRRVQRGLDGIEEGLLIPSGTQNQIPEISDSRDPVRSRKPSPLGSSLGLVQAFGDKGVYCEAMKKLPEPIASILQSCLLPAASDAQERCDWKGEIFNYEQIRELLKLTKRYVKVENKTFEWLLSWFDLPLANLYQYRAREFVRAQKIWEEMRNCAGSQTGLDQAFLTQGYQMMIDALSLEKKEENDSSCVTDNPRAVLLCFWLYFGHHRFQSWSLALKWLQKAKSLETLCKPEDRNFANTEFSEHLPNDYHYFLGEDDLLHRVHDLQRARELSLLADTNKHDGDRIAEQLPSPTGIILQANNKFAVQSKLVQSQVGLQHHLHKLPLIFHLAFRIHGNRGCSYSDHNKWEMAIFHFEWCKEILKLVMRVNSGNPEIADSCCWLMVWATLPLTKIYVFQKNQFEKAFNLQMDMERMIPDGDSDELRSLKDSLRIARFTTLYQYCVSLLKNPDLKKRAVRDFGDQRTNQDAKASENYILTELFWAYMDNGNLKAALGFIQEAKRYLSSDDNTGISKNVELEAFCYINLGMHDAAKQVIKDYGRSTSTPSSKLPPRMKQMLKTGFNAHSLFILDKSGDSSPRRLDKQERILRILGLMVNDKKRWNDETWEKLDKEVRGFENSCMDPANNKGKRKTALENELDYGDYLLLSGLRVGLCLRTIESFNFDQIKSKQIEAFRQDQDFQWAEMYCEKYIELSPDSAKSLSIARSNFFLAHLYGALDSKYHEYLLSLMKRLRQTVQDGNRNDISLQQFLLNEELCSYFNRELTPVQKYGKEAGLAYDSLLGNTNYSEDQWLTFLERHKQLYSLLQVYHCKRAELCEFLYEKIDKKSPIQDQRKAWIQTAFMYSEAERSQSMLYQLVGSSKLNSSFKWSLDESEGIQYDWRRAVPHNGLFVQYSNLVENGRAFMIYVLGGEPYLDVLKRDVDSREQEETITPTSRQPRNLEDRLDVMYKYLDKKDLGELSYNDLSLEKDLEFLYDLLVRPLAYHINKMKEDHHLILSPNELFTKVPFAALRDSKTGKYLIQSHTISLTPSLRVLRACNERLQELQGARLCTDRLGSIVLLGDPTYDCPQCTRVDVKRKSLPESGKEVDIIAKMFGTEAQVVTLKQKKATAKELVHWATQPSEAGFRQAILHIGAHGDFDKKDHRNNVLILACDPASGSANAVSSTSSDVASTGGGSRGQPNDFVFSDEDLSDSDDEADPTIESNLPTSERMCMDSMVDSGVRRSRNDSRDRGAGSIDKSHGLTSEFISSSDPKWKAELVVLSACQTSRGRETTEGVLSMARSFIISGVPCVVASLWSVDDEATKELMELFYDALRKGASVARALRFAMLSRLRIHPLEVHKWAPFNLWGDPSHCIPRALQLQNGPGAGRLYYDPNPPRFVIQNRETLRQRFFESQREPRRPDPVYYDERYGRRDGNPSDAVVYDPSNITRSKFAQEMNSMYKWSWFKNHESESSRSGENESG